jgi:hypothetical protein
VSVLAQLPVGASAEEVHAACMDGLAVVLERCHVLAGEGPELVAVAREAAAELARDADIAHELGLGPCTCGGEREDEPSDKA